MKKLISRGIPSYICVGSHKGPGAARNIGIKNSHYDYIAFIDSDDLWEINKIEEIYMTISKNPQVNFICHNEYRLSINNKKSKIH